MSEDFRFENTCRVCLEEAGDLRSIFRLGTVCDEQTTIAFMLTQFTSLEFYPDDGLPPHVCYSCVIKISRAYKLRETCLNSDATLREKLERMKSVVLDDDDDSKEKEVGTIYYYVDGTEEGDTTVEDSDVELAENETEDVENENADETLEEKLAEVFGEESQSVELEQGNEIDLESTFEQPEQPENVEMRDNQAAENQENPDMLDAAIKQEIQEPQSQNFQKVQRNEYRMPMPQHCSKPDIQIVRDITDNIVPNDELSQEMSQNLDGNPTEVFTKKRQRSKKLPGPPFKCEICGKILSNHSSYKYHMQLHSDNTPYLCSECGEGFKTRNAYDGHMMTHNKNNPHTCHICGKVYRQAGSLRCHMHTHTGEKPFLCGTCGKGMTQKSGFKKHMLTHTGEKPYQCDLCGKYFRYSSNLITHRRCHLSYPIPVTNNSKSTL